MLNDNKKYLIHTLACSTLIILLMASEFVRLPYSGLYDIATNGLHFTVISAAIIGLVGIVLASPACIAIPIYSIIAFLSSILAFFKFTTGFSLNTMIIDTVVHSGIETNGEMVSWHLILFVFFSTIFAIFLSAYRRKYSLNLSDWKNICSVAFFIILITVSNSGRFLRPVQYRIPYNLFYTTIRFLNENREIKTERGRLFSDARTDADSLIVVSVIGESLRAKNLHINGYYRENTPNIENYGFLSFPKVYSVETYTNTAVPVILSRADSANCDIAYSERSFIDIFKTAGFKTTFIANQDAEQPYRYFINEADSVIFTNLSRDFYSTDLWVDGDVLPFYFQQLNYTNNQLIVIHTIGSHWWYNSHFDESHTVFTPIVKSKIVSSCDSSEIVNSYDNTVVYTDWLLSQIVKPLTDKKAVVLYLSDHGESLGEDGIWLHASEQPEQHHPAALIWASEKYRQEFSDSYNACKAISNDSISSGYYYHSIIDAARISTSAVDTLKSIFR